MSIWTIDDSQWAYRLDFGLYTAAALSMVGWLTLQTPAHLQWVVWVYAACGALAWSGVEYALHRFVLHGLQPFARWHEAHHDRPSAWISSSTLLSGGLFVGVVFVPALLLLDGWRACALTLGLVVGYMGYTVTHHAIHHWRVPGQWLQERKRWHGRHHHHTRNAVCFGVTNSWWDHIFGTAYTKGK